MDMIPGWLARSMLRLVGTEEVVYRLQYISNDNNISATTTSSVGSSGRDVVISDMYYVNDDGWYGCGRMFIITLLIRSLMIHGEYDALYYVE